MALDATTLGTRFAVLAISVVYRGCAIPVAWTILPANHPRPGGATGCGCCAAAAGHPARLDGHRAGRSRPVCPLAVSAHRAAGLAPLPAGQSGGHLSPRPAGHLPPPAQFRARTGHALAGHRHGLQGPAAAAALHPAGLLGRGLHRPLADPDRSAPRGQRGPGTACGPGSSRGSNAPNAPAGSGSAPA